MHHLINSIVVTLDALNYDDGKMVDSIENRFVNYPEEIHRGYCTN